jgi:2-polyprenyl-3-methyl-5-hydroxy-6-metoxy-1,4-benzoquinol methylase
MTTQRDFDKEAAGWEEKPERVRLAADVSGAMMRQVAFGPDMDVLDFGCGTGLIALALAPQVRNVTGADRSRGMIEVLSAKAARQGRENVRTRQLSDGGGLGGPYDAIVSSMTFHHVERIEPLLAEMFAALKPGGWLGVADLDPDQGEFHEDNTGVFHFGFERAAMRSMFAGAGFSSVSDTTAATVTKPTRQGIPRPFTIFLVAGRRPAG